MEESSRLSDPWEDLVPHKYCEIGASMSIRPLRWILLAPVLTLLLLGHSYGGKWQSPPGGQPEQTQSRVNYDPKLTDPFFEREEWSYWEGSRTLPDRGMWLGDKEPPLLKHTARCFSTSFNVKHEVRFCEAKLLDGNVIDLFISEHNPAFDDSLRIRIRNGEFTCQYWIVRGVGAFKWTTTRQRLTLDKKVYKKGDVVNGGILFECLNELINPKDIERWRRDPTCTIKVFGVFKTIVE